MLKYGECHYPPEYITKFLLKILPTKNEIKWVPYVFQNSLRAICYKKKKKYEKGCEEEK